MAVSTIDRTYDLHAGAPVIQAYQLNAVCGEKLAHLWRVTVKDGAAAADLTGYTAIANVVRNGVTVPILATIAGNVVSATLTQEAYDTEGAHTAQMWIANAVTGIEKVIDLMVINVASGLTDTVADPDDIVPDLPLLLAQYHATNELLVKNESLMAAMDTRIDDAQAQINVLVVDGDSSVEAAQARINAAAEAFPTLKARLDDSDARVDDAINKMPTKVVASYGHSIVNGGLWQAPLAAKYKFTHKKHGYDGASLCTSANTILDASRIAALEADNPDAVMIMIGTNDYSMIYATTAGIGDQSQLYTALGSKDKTTFYGAYSWLIETLLTWKPTLRIIILGVMYANADFSHADYNMTYHDLSDVCSDVAAYYGLPFVPLDDLGFNAFTYGPAPYNILSSDQVHPNALGAARIAEAVDPALSRIFKYDA